MDLSFFEMMSSCAISPTSWCQRSPGFIATSFHLSSGRMRIISLVLVTTVCSAACSGTPKAGPAVPTALDQTPRGYVVPASDLALVPEAIDAIMKTAAPGENRTWDGVNPDASPELGHVAVVVIDSARLRRDA